MIEGMSYDAGKRHAQKQQAEGIQPTTEHKRVLLKVAEVRDALRQSTGKNAIEQAMQEHLDGYLSQWD